MEKGKKETSKRRDTTKKIKQNPRENKNTIHYNV